MANSQLATTAQSMGKVLALTRALHAKDRAIGEMFVPATHAEAVRLLVGAYACLGFLLSDTRFSGSILKEAARLAERATIPAARQVLTSTLAYIGEDKVLVPNNHRDTLTALVAACGFIHVLASDQRLGGVEEELKGLNRWAMLMMQQDSEQPGEGQA